MKRKGYHYDESECNHNYWTYKPVSPRGYKLKRVCDSCGKILDKNVFPARTFEGFIRRWVHNQLTGKTKKGIELNQTSLKGGRYIASKNKLIYRGAGRNVSYGEDVLAIRLPDGRVIGNASRLNRCGSYSSGSEAPAQRVMQQLEMPLIPFNIFEESKLDLLTAEVIEQGKPEKLTLPKLRWSDSQKMLVPVELWEEKYRATKKPKKTKFIRDIRKWTTSDSKGKTVTRYNYEYFVPKNLEKRHFIGAMVLKVKENYYLFDVDRRELEFYRFNAFLVELPKPCKTIKEAYEMLKPKEVKEALKKGLSVKRQGEWFFIPATLPKKIEIQEAVKKLADATPQIKKYDLDYNEWDIRNNNYQIDKDDIQEHLEEIDDRFKKDHLKRIEAYNRYRRKWNKALELVHQSDPDKYAIRGRLKAGDNRENNVKKFITLPTGIFVKGEVTHSGREHEPLNLRTWHKPIPNTAKKSFTIEGDID